MTMSSAHRPPAAGHAVVIGGSMAGLVAARVLADHFEHVTLLDRDELPDDLAFRPGVPQSRQIHVLLTSGQRILEDLFPGLEADLAEAGAVSMDWIGDSRTLNAGGWVRRFPSSFRARTCSRVLLEWSVRRRLAERPNVALRGGCEVVGVVAGRHGQAGPAVAGVRMRARSREEHSVGPEEETAADLIVDASGRDSRAPDWLLSLGYPRVRETVVNSFLGYATRTYRLAPEAQPDWKLLLISAVPPASSRGGAILAIEGNQWIVTLVGVNRDYPPTDDAGFLEFARSLPTPLLYEAIRDAEPVSPIHGYRRTENRLRHYEELARWPDGLAIVGDAVCCFNPVYGQGMSAAARGAALLGECLRQAREDHRGEPERLPSAMARRFQKELAKLNAAPWLMATGEDFRFPGTEGARPGALTRTMYGYIDAVLRATAHDPLVVKTFIEVAHLLQPPAAFFRPAVVGQVLAQELMRFARGASQAGQARPPALPERPEADAAVAWPEPSARHGRSGNSPE